MEPALLIAAKLLVLVVVDADNVLPLLVGENKGGLDEGEDLSLDLLGLGLEHRQVCVDGGERRVAKAVGARQIRGDGRLDAVLGKGGGEQRVEEALVEAVGEDDGVCAQRVRLVSGNAGGDKGVRCEVLQTVLARGVTGWWEERVVVKLQH